MSSKPDIVDFDEVVKDITSPLKPLANMLGKDGGEAFSEWKEAIIKLLWLVAARAQYTAIKDHDYMQPILDYAIATGFDPDKEEQQSA